MLTQQLEDEECGVTFVEVPYGGLYAECTQGTDTADAEDHLLPDTGGLVTAVEAMGDVAVAGCVFRRIGIEQVDRHAANLGFPEACDHVAAGNAHGDFDPLSAGIACGLDGQIARVMLTIFRVLDSVVVHRLREVALLVKQADGDEVTASVAGGFA